ncbi:MAG: hypothetical protein KKF62_05855 [Bacteroidetes bacterium]|nr:hypothetical protein [Bacteroidota bacterium]MBU1115875.1 hypothetical protein [Bacteroidota bacterium]MBU1797989.1 hypothetical protein [Bacteroidota bacterium]
MKKNIFLAIFTLAFLVLIIGCNEKSDLPNNPEQNANEAGDFYVLGIDDAMASIEDATLEKNMNFTPDFESNDFFFDGRHERKDKFKGKGLRLGVVFSKLDLNENQKDTIKTIFDENRECLSIPFKQFCEAAKEIMENRKDVLKAIRDKVKNGELSRADAQLEIKKINEATREEIENNEACAEARIAICACNTNMLENIASILDETQLALWNKWLSERPNPCIGG